LQKEDRVASTAPINLGFLTVLHEANGYVGGYMVTNNWGRPLEFRLTTAVQPNRVQQILYAATLKPYLCADLIGKTLVDRTAAAVQLLVTDTGAVLELRPRVEVPVVWVAAADDPAGLAGAGTPACVEGPARGRGPVLAHPRYPDDVPAVRALLAGLEGLIDLTEPFARIREAIAEARKLGVASRN
jgi:hypothetical protein